MERFNKIILLVAVLWVIAMWGAYLYRDEISPLGISIPHVPPPVDIRITANTSPTPAWQFTNSTGVANCVGTLQPTQSCTIYITSGAASATIPPSPKEAPPK